MQAQSSYSAPTLGVQPHYGNLFGSGFVILFGAGLVLCEPLFGIELRIRNLPGVVAQAAGGVAILVGILGVLLLPKTQRKCPTCQKGLEEGEAAFPVELDGVVRQHVRNLDPAPLMTVPVGSRFGDGPQFEFNFCASCRAIGELSLSMPPGQKNGSSTYEFERRVVTGPIASAFAQIVETHERVRDANNASR